VGVLGASGGDAVPVDDADGFVEGELGAFDEVGEVRLVERQADVRGPGFNPNSGARDDYL
jgi:hypothetical protein